jgi:hypothetical protein
MEVARAGAHLGVEAGNGFEVVVEDVGFRFNDDLQHLSSHFKKSGVRISIVVPGARLRIARMVMAKCSAPPSSRSSRSTEVMTTWFSPSFCTASATRPGSNTSRSCGRPRGHVAEGAAAGADLAHDHHGGVALRPAFARIGAARLLADGHQLVLAHDLVGLAIALAHRRLDPDPAGLSSAGHCRRDAPFRGGVLRGVSDRAWVC